ncbi:MAG: TIGR03960 family B12-binding radical SAM protein, partial [Clostridia bacterium]|nr:TIGR03960 family B12-binding radical SAM protein [Clostridia bacterium]
GCRFCQAGMVYRPVREKSPEVLNEQAKAMCKNTGYGEISMTSLSISDYSCLDTLTDDLLAWTNEKKINLSLPSLRADSFTKELMDKISTVRTSSLTFAPEAGTQRLRDAINKNLDESDLMNAVRVAFDAGKNLVKLYFMNGLPTETYEDIAGIAELAQRVVHEFYRNGKPKGRGVTVTVSVSCFIPKPHTPFQWEPQDSLESLMHKQMFLAEKITDRRVRYNWHDAKVSRVEAVFARGDRRLAPAIALAVSRGMRFDAWDEYFDYDKWESVFRDTGIDPAFYANRRFGEDEILPWDVIDIGVSKEFMLREMHKAHESRTTPNCKETCSGCGANKLGGDCRWCPQAK